MSTLPILTGILLKFFRKADELMTDCKIQEVKEYLKRVRYQKIVVNSLNEHLEQLRMEIYSVKGYVLTDKVQSSNHASLDDLICRLESEESEVNEALGTLIEYRRQAKELIRCEEDERIKSVLLSYYILCADSWDEVAAKMGYNVRQVFRLRDQGLEDLTAYFNKTCQ